jgi:hypothetical protein
MLAGEGIILMARRHLPNGVVSIAIARQRLISKREANNAQDVWGDSRDHHRVVIRLPGGVRFHASRLRPIKKTADRRIRSRNKRQVGRECAGKLLT